MASALIRTLKDMQKITVRSVVDEIHFNWYMIDNICCVNLSHGFNNI